MLIDTYYYYYYSMMTDVAYLLKHSNAFKCGFLVGMSVAAMLCGSAFVLMGGYDVWLRIIR